MFKKGSKVENTHTQEKREITAIVTVTEQRTFEQVTVYVLDDKSRWAEDFYEHWREVK